MITKYCRTKTYHEALLPKNLHNPLDMGSRGTHWTSREHQIFTITMRMVNKLYKVVTYSVEVPPINSSDPSMRLSCKVKWEIESFIDTFAEKPMGTKQGKLLTYREKLPPLKPQDTLIRWPTWSQVTIWITDSCPFARLICH